MPAEESKPVAEKAGAAPKAKDPDKGKNVAIESDDEDDGADDEAAALATTTSAGAKKRRSKKKKGKDAETPEAVAKNALAGLTEQQAKELLALNPALADQLAANAGAGSSSGSRDISELLKKLSLQEIMTGLAASGKNVKDMGAYKFWQTQPVPRFGEQTVHEEGPLKIQKVEDVPENPFPLIDGFEWVTMDVTDDAQMKEISELLAGHYVEDDEALFRFNYSSPLLKWALMAPGWKKEWHVGVRVAASKKLVAFISAIPVRVRVRANTVLTSEVNFLCVHKKLRGKRLAPVLIKEITRRSNRNGIWQGLYTAGVVLPTPVSTCRYFHRAINWSKLYEVGFSPLPAHSKPQFQVRKYALPENTAIRGLREMRAGDVDGAYDLYKRYMAKYDMVPEFSKEEFAYWFVQEKKGADEQVIWSYVVEGEGKKITDFFSFYCLESSVINNAKHQVIRAAYLFYYATETGLAAAGSPPDRTALKARLNALMNDGLVLAKRFKFDVFNALSLMDNALFLEQQKFGPGDGQLHYYFFNYRANPIAGGVDRRNVLDDKNLSGLGLVMF